MDRERVLATCGALTGATEEYPFGDEVAVFKVGGKVFALVALGPEPVVSLKCDPLLSEDLRSQFAAITPGYHLNKRHWISVQLDGTLAPSLVGDLVTGSYQLIVDKLPKAVRTQLA